MIKQRNFWIYVLLSIVTCGIYSIIFWYMFAEDMNTICQRDGKQTQNIVIVILLSIVTCGIYWYIWCYGVGNRLQENAPGYGLSFNENGTTILLWMLLGYLLCGIGTLYAYYLLINNMNALADRYNQQYYGGGGGYQQQNYQQPPFNNQ